LRKGLAMRTEDQVYHQARAEQCRRMAELATDPDIRRRHEELAALHAGRIQPVEPVQPAVALSAA
jgi:hypothetical protein